MKPYSSSVRGHSAIVFLVILSLTVLLSACGGTMETDLTLYINDRFDAHIRATLPAAALALSGGAEALEAQFKEAEKQAASQDFEFSWRRERSGSADGVAYSFDMSGTGYENLSQFNIEVNKTQVEGEEALSVSAGRLTDLDDAQSTFRLHVGKIIETDNRRESNSTIVWTGDESLRAIVTPKSDTNWLPTILVILGIAAAAVVAFIFLRRRPIGRVVTATTTPPVVRTGRFCPHCGQPTQPDSRFCMSCGQAIPPRQG